MRKVLAAAVLAAVALPATSYAHVCMDDAYKFCRELIPDLWDMAQFVDEALEELKARAKQSGSSSASSARSGPTRPARRR